MFSILARGRAAAAHEPSTRSGGTGPLPRIPGPEDPHGQAELVERSLGALQALRTMLQQGGELPLGDREDLLRQVDCTLEQLQPLTYIDVVY